MSRVSFQVGDLLPRAAVSGIRLSSFYLNHFLLWFRFVKKQVIKFTEIIGKREHLFLKE